MKASQTQTSGTENSIEPRTRRACVESMVVVHADANAWTVYSGETSRYTVEIDGGRWSCDCPDAEHNLSDGEQCKHARRTRMEIGDMEIPDLGRATPSDVELMVDAPEPEPEAEPEPVEPEIEVEPVEAAARQVVADGGWVIDASDPQGSDAEDTDSHARGCSTPECEGFDADGRPVLSFECWEVWS